MIIVLTNSSVDECPEMGTLVGKLCVDVSSEPEPVNELWSYELVSDDEDKFTIEHPTDAFDAAFVNTDTSEIYLQYGDRIEVGDVVSIYGGKVVPEGLSLTAYYDVSEKNGKYIKLIDHENKNPIDITVAGAGIFRMVNRSITNVYVRYGEGINYEKSKTETIVVSATNEDGITTQNDVVISVNDTIGDIRIKSVDPLASMKGSHPLVTIRGVNFTEKGFPDVFVDDYSVDNLKKVSDNEIQFVLVSDLGPGKHVIAVDPPEGA